MNPEIELDRTYYIYKGNVYKYREEIEDILEYSGLDDNLTDWLDGIEIEEVSAIELINRIGDENLCLMW